MKIAFITAGAGGTICGNCLRDNALAAAMLRLGEDVTLLPVYTPIRTDETDVSTSDVYLGGVNIYLRRSSALFRKLPPALTRPLDNPALLRWVSKFAVKTQPADLGALTVATIQGADGPLKVEVERLAEALAAIGPEVVHLTNSMLTGLARPLAERLGVPIVCSLQGEDVYLDGLPDPYRTEAYAELKRQAHAVDLFVAPCRDHAQALAGRIGRQVRDVAVVYPGIDVAGYEPAQTRPDRPFTVGYMARIAPEKGLDRLAAALPEGAALEAAGWVSPEHEDWVAGIERTAGITCRRDVSRSEKAELLRSVDALSVPTAYGASKGLYVLEAWASGVPVVQPRIGIFPELIEDSEAGLLFTPGDDGELRASLERLRDDPDEARAMGRRGRKLVEDRYTAERMARETLALYNALLR